MGEPRKEKKVTLRIREGSRIWKLLEEHPDKAYSETVTKYLEEYLDVLEGIRTVPNKTVTLQGDTITLKEIAKFMKEISLQLQPLETYFIKEIVKKKGEEN